MDCDNYKKLLQEYHDNELEKGGEADLFSHLSRCCDCRDYFKNINFISANIKYEDFPDELDERILFSIKEKNPKKRRGFFGVQLFPVLSYAAAVLLLVISIFLFMKADQYKNEITAVNREITIQNRTIKLLYNSLPPAEVSSYYNKKNEIVIKANM